MNARVLHAPCLQLYLSLLNTSGLVYLYFNDLKMYLDRYKGEIIILCQKNKVRSLYVFGSVMTESFDDKSDIDLIVDIDSGDPLIYADSYFNLKFALEELLNRQIDLFEDKAIRNSYLREHIDNSKMLLYAS